MYQYLFTLRSSILSPQPSGIISPQHGSRLSQCQNWKGQVEQAGGSKDRTKVSFPCSVLCTCPSSARENCWDHSMLMVANHFLSGFPLTPQLPFSTHPRSVQLTCASVGTCGEEHVVYCPDHFFALWKWAVCWAPVTSSLSSIAVNFPNFWWMVTSYPWFLMLLWSLLTIY